MLAQLAAVAITVSAGGWTINADPQQGRLSLTHDGLGTVMENIRVNTGNWSAEKGAANQLVLKSAEPRAGWVFELRENLVKISSTTERGVVTATTPATKDRVVARLVDPEGTPVDWAGTREVVGSYGGSDTRKPSFLPRRNPDCMYFALGQVSGRGFHSLFDRKTDTAIRFDEGVRMERNREDRDRMDLTIPVAGNAVVRIIPDYYTRTLGVPYYAPFDDSHFSRAPMVWSSWTSYYAAVREEDIVRNTDWLAANLKPYGFEYVQLDDGFDRGKNGEHYWIEKWDQQQFPHGPEWLAKYIRSKGLKAGLWVVPNAYAGAVEEHPDWYLRDKAGKFILDYRTPSLDSTHPGAAEFLVKLFRTLDDWGFDYYKFDGEHALPQYAPNVDREKLHEKGADYLAAYRERLRLIRETIGPERFIEGCPAGTPLNGIGYFNSYFNGEDLYSNWQGMYALFSSITANAFLNKLLVYVMPGEGLELGPPMTIEEAKGKRPPQVVRTAQSRENPLTGVGVNDAEARTLVSYIALTGVAYPLASVMPELPPSRVKLLAETMPTMPILPVDLFSRGNDASWDKFRKTQPDYYVHNYPEILDLKVNGVAGEYDVVGVTNWRSGPVTKDLDLEQKLGLRGGRPYLVFDFWNRKVLGVFRNRVQVPVGPHDTRVLLIRALEDRPQLAGISRHISGEWSVRSLAWDAKAKALRGSAETVAGEPYTVWIHVPAGTAVARARATAGGRAVAVRQQQTGEALAVTFDGRAGAVDWEVGF